MIGVYLHATAIPVILMVAYVSMLVNLRAHMRRRNAFFTCDRCDVVSGTLENPTSTIIIEDGVERQFIRMNLRLTVLVVLFTCTLPSIVVMHIALNAADASFKQQTNLAVAQNIAEDFIHQVCPRSVHFYLEFPENGKHVEVYGFEQEFKSSNHKDIIDFNRSLSPHLKLLALKTGLKDLTE